MRWEVLWTFNLELSTRLIQRMVHIKRSRIAFDRLPNVVEDG
jgi:hypothetical protein